MEHKRRIRSFVRRQGRMTQSQKDNLKQLWPIYGLTASQKTFDWDAIFGRSAKRTLEIGFGAGESVYSQATQYPDQDFIGIEVYKSGVGRLLGQLHDAGAKNVRVFCDDAVEVLANSFADNTLDQVLLYFPDPWPKKRHHKRRIVQTAFADEINRILKPGGLWRLATDWADYAYWMREVLDHHDGFKNIGNQQGWVTEPPRIETRFERRGVRKNHSVFDMAYQKVSQFN